MRFSTSSVFLQLHVPFVVALTCACISLLNYFTVIF